MAVGNAGTTPLNGWTISFDADFTITEIWNARIVGHNGNRYTIQNIPGSFNSTIAPNATGLFGFNATLPTTGASGIQNIPLNGANV